MAIRQHHAARIYRGEKRFEFRRRRPRFELLTKVYIYEPTPVRMVSGFFYASEILDIGDDIGAFESDERESAFVAEYLRDARQPTAIRVGNPCRLEQPALLTTFGVVAAPQSYVYVRA
jgi:predicted transcriptional regulator